MFRMFVWSFCIVTIGIWGLLYDGCENATPVLAPEPRRAPLTYRIDTLVYNRKVYAMECVCDINDSYGHHFRSHRIHTYNHPITIPFCLHCSPNNSIIPCVFWCRTQHFQLEAPIHRYIPVPLSVPPLVPQSVPPVPPAPPVAHLCVPKDGKCAMDVLPKLNTCFICT